MKKKLLIALIAITSAICGAFGFSACFDNNKVDNGNGGNTNQGGNTQNPEHTAHKYDKKVTETQFLKTEATCTNRAEYYFSCECGKMGTEVFEYGEFADHVFNSYFSDNNATCTENGTETALCEICKTTTDTREMPDSATGEHSFINYISDGNATCVDNGTETAKCEHCNETDTRAQENSATGIHSFINYVSDNNATCINNGTETAKCENCEAKDTREMPDSATGEHNFINYISDGNATCVDNGTETAICENCNETDTREQENSATGIHSFVNYVSDNNATCANNGTETATCENCEATDVREEAGSKLPHVFENGICQVCQRGYTEGLEFVLRVDGTGYIVKKGSATDNDICIPNIYNGLPVTSIGSFGFKDCSSLVSVTIPDSVTVIDGYAFWVCSQLSYVIIRTIAYVLAHV